MSKFGNIKIWITFEDVAFILEMFVPFAKDSLTHLTEQSCWHSFDLDSRVTPIWESVSTENVSFDLNNKALKDSTPQKALENAREDHAFWREAFERLPKKIEFIACIFL